jgi:hypothetical protein
MYWRTVSRRYHDDVECGHVDWIHLALDRDQWRKSCKRMKGPIEWLIASQGRLINRVMMKMIIVLGV